VRLRPRHLDLHHSVVWELDSWDTGMDQGVELAGVEMPPLPLRGMVVAGKLTATIRTASAVAFGMVHVDVDLC